jgi:ABC-type nitrate/sulfonate/bicarbonate transport system permease component
MTRGASGRRPGGRRPRRGEILALQLGVLVVLLGVWEIGTRAGTLDPLLFSRPSAIAEAAWELYVAEGTIWPELATSAREVGLGLGAAILAGIPLGLLFGRLALLGQAVQPFLVAVLSTPIVAIMPLFLVWFGVGLMSKVALIFLGAVTLVTVNVAAGARAVKPEWLDLAAVYSARKPREFFEIVLPASVPSMIVGIRLAVAAALITMFVAEFFASAEGIGHLIVMSGSNFQVATFFVAVLTLTGAGMGASALLRALERGPLARFAEL